MNRNKQLQDRRRKARFLGVVECCLILLILSGCSKRQQIEVVQQPRPVTVLKLVEFQPESRTRYTGTVSAWKAEDIGFEVGGRIESLVEPGTDVIGPEYIDATSDDRHPGQVIAQLGKERYEIQLQSALARVKSTEAQRDTIQNELTKILPKQIVAAEVDLKFTSAEYTRQKDLFDQNAGTRTELDQALAARDTAQAQLDQLQETLIGKKAELQAYEAQIEEAKEAVASAERDLLDTALKAPFSGRIAESYKTLGSVVQPGEAVFQLQMMNPMLINVEVDSQTDARLNYGDIVLVYPPDAMDQPSRAMVYETASVADPSTRTFLINLLMLNNKIATGLPENVDAENDLRTRELFGIFQEHENDSSPYYLNENGLYRDDQGAYIFRVKNLNGASRVRTSETEFEVEKVYVSLADDRLSIFDVASFRKLKELGDLKPKHDMFVGTLQSIAGQILPKDVASSRLEKRGKLFWVRERWQLRPGDFLDVELGEDPLERGFYVPMDAVVRSIGSTKSYLFVVNPDEEPLKVQRLEVAAFPSIDSDKLVRIVPANPDELQEGALVVEKGTHYLTDGESVRVTNLPEVSE